MAIPSSRVSGGLGCTNSRAAKQTMVTTPNQPLRTGSGRQSRWAGTWPKKRRRTHEPTRASVSQGLSSRHTSPNTAERKSSPTQNPTYTATGAIVA